MTIEYIAGFFDGEGNVSKRGWILTFTNTHRIALEMMRQSIGGVINPRRKRTGSLGKKPVYDLKICGRLNVMRVLSLLVPHLIVKRELAALRLQAAIEWKPVPRPVHYCTECGAPQLAKGLCSKHYQRRRISCQ